MLRVSGHHTSGDRLDSNGITSAAALRDSALAGFRLRFGNGGHQLKRIGVLAEDDAVRFSLEDADGHDPIEYVATFVTFDPADIVRRVILEGSCPGNRADVPLGPGDPASIALLQGFRLSFADGTDHELSTIGIDPEVDTERGRMTQIQLYSHDQPDAGLDHVVQLIWVRRTAFHALGYRSAGPSTNDLTDAEILDQTDGRGSVIRGFGLHYVRNVRGGTAGHLSEPDSHYVARVAVELGPFDPGASTTSVGMDDGDRDDQVWKWISFAVL